MLISTPPKCLILCYSFLMHKLIFTVLVPVLCIGYLRCWSLGHSLQLVEYIASILHCIGHFNLKNVKHLVTLSRSAVIFVFLQFTMASNVLPIHGIRSNKHSKNVKSEESILLNTTGNCEGTIVNYFIRKKNSNELFQQQRSSLAQI